jgi:hypothetical protein
MDEALVATFCGNEQCISRFVYHSAVVQTEISGETRLKEAR